MVDFDSLLLQKYAGQSALRDAQANLTNTQAQNYAADQAARIKAAQTSANAALLDAQSSAPLKAAQAQRTTALIDPETGLMRAQTGLAGEQTATSALNRSLLNTLAPAGAMLPLLQRLIPTHRLVNDIDGDGVPDTPSSPTGGVSGSPSTRILPRGWKPLGFAKGTAKVPGKGSGKVDTVPAMLAPGEAVLNKGAAEHVGRDAIKQLNTLGQLKMGIVPGKAGKGAGGQKSKSAPTPAKGSKKPAGGPNAGGRQHFAMGTSDVTPQPMLSSSGGGTGAGTMAGGTVTPLMMLGMPTQQSDYLMDQLGVPSPTPPTQTPVRYATGHSNVGKGKQSDTPKPTAANVRLAIKKLEGLGMAKKPLPKGFGNPGMV